MAQTIHSPGKIFTNVITIPSESPPRDTGPNLVTSLLFLRDSVWVFLTALLVQESFYQFPVRIVPHEDVFLMSLWKEVSFMSSYSAILISSLKLKKKFGLILVSFIFIPKVFWSIFNNSVSL